MSISLSKYYQEYDDGIGFTRAQASEFAKQIAGDFNPLHDPENKMFCVPGDLLFTLALCKLGLSEKMRFTFSGMVDDSSRLKFNEINQDAIEVSNTDGKVCLGIERSGDRTENEPTINGLARKYVEFSGRTFPHILVPLMEQQQVMINPSRPLVIYESMEIDLLRLDIQDTELEITDTSLEVNGKKGRVKLGFCLKQTNEIVGNGAKYMSLRGLRPYENDAINGIVDDYMQRINDYK